MPFILRHPESFYNAAPPLVRAEVAALVVAGKFNHHLRDAGYTPRGVDQASALVNGAGTEALFPGVKVIYSSPLWRALFLAVLLGARLKVPVRVSADLREVRRDISDIGTPASALAAKFPGLGLERFPEQWWNPAGHCPETAECDECITARLAAVEALAAENPDALFVSHGDLLLALSGFDLGNCEVAPYTPPARP